jgi:hypothetical protein
MQEVLMVYRDVCLHSEGAVHDARREPIYTVSVDEKPSVQAIYLTAPDLPPVPGKAVGVGRDYEDVRRGTVSILAGIDLHSGKIFANVEDRHRSSEFIALLRKLDEHYPPEATIRVVLDNNSAHISKETLADLGTRPGRFEYVHTPKHGFLAEPDRVRLLQDGVHIRASHPRGIGGRTQGAHLARRCGVRRRTCGLPRGRLMTIRFAGTIY